MLQGIPKTDILIYLSFIFNTRCHVTLRSALNFVYAIAEHLEGGFAKITLCIKLFKKIAWIAEGKVYCLSNSNTITSVCTFAGPIELSIESINFIRRQDHRTQACR